jgi:RNA-directed DNA polymerase
MKRHGNLWPQIIDFGNFKQAAKQAQRGKRFRQNVLEFNYNLEASLNHLQESLVTKTYQPGAYHTFRICDPKPRLISAAPYADRVVHHALCNIIIPLLDHGFIADTYANRKGFGTHRALRRFQQFTSSHQYVLQCDIKKYFPSIDHEILKSQIRHQIKCPDTLWLIDRIIDSSNPQDPVVQYFPGDDLLTPITRRHGLPIGNLTSQFFANLYLDRFDHFIKEHLRIRGYLRYVDDFALFSNDRQQLVAARTAIEEYLQSLRLILHPIKTQIIETCYGVNFVGFRLLPLAQPLGTGDTFPKVIRVRVRNDNLRRARRRLQQLQQDHAQGLIPQKALTQRLRSWQAHLLHGHTYRLRQHIFRFYKFSQFL